MHLTTTIVWYLFVVSTYATPITPAPPGCILAISEGSYTAAAVFEATAQQCTVLGTVPAGQTGAPHFEGPAGTWCYFLYEATVSKVQAGLTANGYGVFPLCAQPTAATATAVIQQKLSGAGVTSTSGETLCQSHHGM